jgi:hypothetical protein
MPRYKAIESPEKLAGLFEDYRTWAEATPYKVHDFVGKDADEVRREKQRPLTWIGFEAWLYRQGILTHLGHYEQNTDKSYTEYLPIIRALKKQCSSDIIDGALAGVYNQNIAARLEGLADKKEVDKKVTTLQFKDAE